MHLINNITLYRCYLRRMQTKPVYLLILFFFINALPLVAQYNEEDWDERDRWMKVDELMDLADVKTGEKVADIGCHEGYFSFHLSKQVGATGKIYAVDVQKYRLDKLTAHIKERGVTNIQVILGEEDDPKLPENELDVVVVMDSYHEMEYHKKVLKHIKRAIKPDGRLLFLEKLKAHKKDASREEQVSSHTLSSAYVRSELEEAGFVIIRENLEFGFWENDSDKQMWVLVAVLAKD